MFSDFFLLFPTLWVVQKTHPIASAVQYSFPNWMSCCLLEVRGVQDARDVTFPVTMAHMEGLTEDYSQLCYLPQKPILIQHLPTPSHSSTLHNRTDKQHSKVIFLQKFFVCFLTGLQGVHIQPFVFFLLAKLFLTWLSALKIV